jgi:hypothetical protein
MISGGFDPTGIIGGAADLIGGAIGSLFGDDEPPDPGSYDEQYKEYAEPASNMMFGSKVGQRIAMGDPTVNAYWKSKMRTDPGRVKKFIDDFGGDFRTGSDNEYYTGDPSYATLGAIGAVPGGSSQFPGLNQPGSFGADQQERMWAEYAGKKDEQASNTEDVLNRTLGRLSKGQTGRTPANAGYSGYSGGFGNVTPEKEGGFQFKSQATPLKLDLSKQAGSGNKYAKLNQERKSGSFF